MDRLTGVAALEAGCAIAFDRRPKMRNRRFDLGGTRAAAIAKPIGKASARGSNCRACRPRQYTVRDSQFAGGRQQAKRPSDSLHLAICATGVLIGKRIDQASCLSKTCVAVGNERFDEGRAGGAEARLCSIDEMARQCVAAILLACRRWAFRQLRRMIEKAKTSTSIGGQINEPNRLPGHMALRCAGIGDLVGQADLARAHQEHTPLEAGCGEARRRGTPAADPACKLVPYASRVLSFHEAQFVEAKGQVAMRFGQAFDGVGGGLPALLVAVETAMLARTAPDAACNDERRGLADGRWASKMDASPLSWSGPRSGAAKAADRASTTRVLPSAGFATRSCHSSSVPFADSSADFRVV